MSKIKALSVDEITTCCDPEQFSFETTDELENLDKIIGQERALKSIRFGIGVKNDGYNLYVLGPPGIGKSTAINQYLQEKAKENSTPSDWCYVNNFQDESSPILLKLPSGFGRILKEGMSQLIEDLQSAIPTAFDSDEYKSRAQLIEAKLQKKEQEAFRALGKEATKHHLKVLQTPEQFSFIPLKDDTEMSPQDFEQLPEDERAVFEKAIAALQKTLQNLLQKEIPKWRKTARESFRKLNHQITKETVALPIESLSDKLSELPDALEYLKAVKSNIIATAHDFIETVAQAQIPTMDTQQPLHRFAVNLILDHAKTDGMPVIYEEHPSYGNLIGRIEHNAFMGAMVTNFTLIKPGALHKANGGYLLLDARKLLMQPYAWEGLKQALYSREVRIQALEQVLSLGSAVTLEPQTMPLDVKVVLLGDRNLYYRLHTYDPDFAELFKVPADFEESLDRNPGNDQLYARLIATIVREQNLRPFDKFAVAAIIHQSMRMTANTEKLSTHMRSIADLVIEASYWADQAGRIAATDVDVKNAVAQQIERVDRVRDQLTDNILRDAVLIDTTESVIGQINALAVYQMGNYRFGKPTRITATTRLGDGKLVDIARETKMGGPTHTKGIFILNSFIGARYGQNQALAFHASIAFEQSYGGIDGDSASLAELCTLLSSLASVPIKQSLAMTGSVNQFGQAQVIGGVNEKVEGFYDICNARMLTGDQGVIIPRNNVKNLVLRHDIIDAIQANKFHIYPVQTIDEAIELLTDVPAGKMNARGQYPIKSVNGKVQRRLKKFADLRNNKSAKSKVKTKPKKSDTLSDSDDTLL